MMLSPKQYAKKIKPNTVSQTVRISHDENYEEINVNSEGYVDCGTNISDYTNEGYVDCLNDDDNNDRDGYVDCSEDDGNNDRDGYVDCLNDDNNDSI